MSTGAPGSATSDATGIRDRLRGISPAGPREGTISRGAAMASSAQQALASSLGDSSALKAMPRLDQGKAPANTQERQITDRVDLLLSEMLRLADQVSRQSMQQAEILRIAQRARSPSAPSSPAQPLGSPSRFANWTGAANVLGGAGRSPGAPDKAAPGVRQPPAPLQDRGFGGSPPPPRWPSSGGAVATDVPRRMQQMSEEDGGVGEGGFHRAETACPCCGGGLWLNFNVSAAGGAVSAKAKADKAATGLSQLLAAAREEADGARGEEPDELLKSSAPAGDPPARNCAPADKPVIQVSNADAAKPAFAAQQQQPRQAEEKPKPQQPPRRQQQQQERLEAQTDNSDEDCDFKFQFSAGRLVKVPSNGAIPPPAVAAPYVRIQKANESPRSPLLAQSPPESPSSPSSPQAASGPAPPAIRIISSFDSPRTLASSSTPVPAPASPKQQQRRCACGDDCCLALKDGMVLCTVCGGLSLEDLDHGDWVVSYQAGRLVRRKATSVAATSPKAAEGIPMVSISAAGPAVQVLITPSGYPASSSTSSAAPPALPSNLGNVRLDLEALETASIPPDKLGTYIDDYVFENGLTDATAMHFAAKAGHVQATKALLDSGWVSRSNAQDGKGQTALHIAAYAGQNEVAKILLSKDSFTKVNVKDREGRTALHIAAFNGRRDVIRTMLAADRFTEVDARDNEGGTALHDAALRGHAEVVRELLGTSRFKQPNGKDKEGWTALHFAASKGHVTVAQALLDSSRFTEVNAQDQKGYTALLLAATKGHAEVALALLASGRFTELNALHSEGWTALHGAASAGCAEVVAALLASDNFTEVNAQDDLCWTALHFAACKGHVQVAKRLLESGRFSKANAKYNEGGTALHLAASKGQADFIRLLLEAKQFSDVNCRDMEGRTALHLASTEGHLEAVKALLDSGGFTAVAVADNRGVTAPQILQELAAKSPAPEDARAILRHPRLQAEAS
eukprot:TRINITY_DN39569_c0_g1_i1.p1 TRINITY_DN39569_c0_g1~~TRINITY_DN39569_c0_g1_i1.p1  ORF type:complete len:968 (-),score=248.95 TRINITY_DN39569_c0_g1_i1:155-3058(-)